MLLCIRSIGVAHLVLSCAPAQCVHIVHRQRAVSQLCADSMHAWVYTTCMTIFASLALVLLHAIVFVPSYMHVLRAGCVDMVTNFIQNTTQS